MKLTGSRGKKEGGNESDMTLQSEVAFKESLRLDFCFVFVFVFCLNWMVKNTNKSSLCIKAQTFC